MKLVFVSHGLFSEEGSCFVYGTAEEVLSGLMSSTSDELPTTELAEVLNVVREVAQAHVR